MSGPPNFSWMPTASAAMWYPPVSILEVVSTSARMRSKLTVIRIGHGSWSCREPFRCRIRPVDNRLDTPARRDRTRSDARGDGGEGCIASAPVRVTLAIAIEQIREYFGTICLNALQRIVGAPGQG